MFAFLGRFQPREAEGQKTLKGAGEGLHRQIFLLVKSPDPNLTLRLHPLHREQPIDVLKPGV